jgi:hypothetical protein
MFHPWRTIISEHLIHERTWTYSIFTNLSDDGIRLQDDCRVFYNLGPVMEQGDSRA